MANYLVMDNDMMRMVALAPTVLQATYIGEIYCRNTDFSVDSINERRWLSRYTEMELRILYYGITGKGLPSSAPYADVLRLVYDEMMEHLPELNETPVETLIEILGRDLSVNPNPVIPEPDHEARRAASTPKTTASAPKRTGGGGSTGGKPKGGTTARVWEIADAILADVGSDDLKLLRSNIIAKCEDEGINSSTAGTQYSKWKKDRLS